VQWTAPRQHEGFLWLDDDLDRSLEPLELLGRRLATPEAPAREAGWRALRDLDRPAAGGDGDGLVTRADDAWAKLGLWIDFDHDAHPGPGELYRLEDWCIDVIELDFAEGLMVDGGLNLRTAWAEAAARETTCPVAGARATVVTEVHFPLAS
jgi:hypothetical protein